MESIKGIIEITYPVWAIYKNDDGTEDLEHPERIFLAGIIKDKDLEMVCFLDTSEEGLIEIAGEVTNFSRFVFGQLPSK